MNVRHLRSYLSRLRPSAIRAGLARRRFHRTLAGPRIIAAFRRTYPDATFVEVGANDGMQQDHLREAIRAGGWRGVMVEPVPYVFNRLRQNFESIERVGLENAAVTERTGRMPFFHLAPAAPEERNLLPDWYDALGSFSREVLSGHVDEIPDIEDRIIKTEVACITFDLLCERHAIAELDLLLIDTEGHDLEVLRSADPARRRPRLIIYEHFHLSPADQQRTLSWLQGLGYVTLREGFDTWCLDAEREDHLTEVWRSVRPGVPAQTRADVRRG